MTKHYPKSERKDKRRRFQFRFWLDVAQDEWYDLAQRLESLKQSRQYAPTIRKALLLYLSLKDKRIDYLLQLFPWIEDAIKAKANPPDSDDNSDLRKEIAMLRQAVLSQTKADTVQHSPRAMNVPSIRTPSFDDDPVDDIVLKRDTSTDSAQNFLNSMLALQG